MRHRCVSKLGHHHYNDVTMSAVASQFTSVSILCSTVGSGADQRKHQSSASLAFCGEFTGDRWFPRTKRPVTRNMFPFDDVIMIGSDSVCRLFDNKRLFAPILVDWTLANIFQWRVSLDTTIFIQKNVKNINLEIVVILSRPQCVDHIRLILWRQNILQFQYD